MADAVASKRQSMGPNAAATAAAASTVNSNRLSIGNAAASSTGKLGNNGHGQGPGELDLVLSKAIGARVKLTLSGPSPLTLEGTIFTACPITNIVAINTSSTSLSSSNEQSPATNNPPKGNYHLIPVSRIQQFNLISLPTTPSTFESAQPPITRVDLKALKFREEAAIRKIKERDAMRGKGVTKEAQDIFDAFARTLPTRWHEKSIIVNDTVMINAPYRVEDCTADKHNQNALARVKKVLESERKKIAERNAVTVAGTASTPASGAATSIPATRKGG